MENKQNTAVWPSHWQKMRAVSAKNFVPAELSIHWSNLHFVQNFLQCVQIIQKYIEFAIWESQCIDHITVWIFLIEAFCQSYLLLVNSVEGWEAKGNSVETRSVKINFTIKSIWSTINLYLALFFPPLSCITVNLKSFASDNDASLS